MTPLFSPIPMRLHRLLSAASLLVALSAPTAAADTPTAGQRFRDCADCPEMIVVPAGQFVMGSPETEAHHTRHEGPQHPVTIARPFAMSRTEVSWPEWGRCVAAGACRLTPDEGYGRGDKPVINMRWHEAQDYVRWLSAHTGKPYRLPSEAEWEYAARAGSTTSRHWGDDEASACRFANVFNKAFYPLHGKNWEWEFFDCNDGAAETMPVGRLQPNAFGLHDLLGNVREWTADCFDDDYTRAPTDGRAHTGGACLYRVTRGGSWVTEPEYIRAAARYWVEPERPNDDIGIRLVRDLQPGEALIGRPAR